MQTLCIAYHLVKKYWNLLNLMLYLFCISDYVKVFHCKIIGIIHIIIVNEILPNFIHVMRAQSYPSREHYDHQL